MKGVRRAATNSTVGSGTSANITQICDKSQGGKRFSTPQGSSDDCGGQQGKMTSSRSRSRSPSSNPTNSKLQDPALGPGVRDLLMQQLATARQDLAQVMQQGLEQMQLACLDSLQLVEAANLQLKRENDRLQAENERLHTQSVGGAHMGGTGESPAPARQQPTNSQEPAPEPGTTSTNNHASGKPSLAGSAVAPPESERPSTPASKEGGPPTMAIPGSVPDGAEARLSHVEPSCDLGEDTNHGHSNQRSDANQQRNDNNGHLECPHHKEGRDSRVSRGMVSVASDSDGGCEADADKQNRNNRRRSVFVDADKMKQKVREAVMKKEYDVKNAYKESGIAATIAKSAVFDHLTLGVILVNAVWIAIEMDYKKVDYLLDAHPIFQIMEFSFFAYFLTEVIIRFVAFEKKLDCLRDPWFVFDSCLVLTMVFDTGVITLVIWANGGSTNGSPGAGGFSNPTILRMFRMLKLTRMARMVRLLRAMPELMILIKGIAIATRSVLFTLALLMIFIYLFAILFKSLTEDGSAVQDDLFPNVWMGMLNLFLRGTLPDQESLVMQLWNENIGLGLLAIFFILLASLTVMNMLVGVLVEVVGVVSTVEREQMNVQFVYAKLLECLTTSGLDADGDMRISKTEFESLLLNPKAARMVQEVGVDVVGLVDFSEYLFQNDATLSFSEFMDLVLQLRGSNTATVKDVVDLRKFISSQVMEINDTINQSYTAAGLPTIANRPSKEPKYSCGPQSRKDGGEQATKAIMDAPPSHGHGPQWAAPRPTSTPTCIGHTAAGNTNSNAGAKNSKQHASFEPVWPTGDSPKRSVSKDQHNNSQMLDEEV